MCIDPDTFPATMLSEQPMSDEDSDLDDHVPLRGATKKKMAVVSDSDED